MKHFPSIIFNSKKIELTVVISFGIILSLALAIIGFRLTPDGWSYMGGAYSISNGHLFADFCNRHIKEFQPLYSLYLSIFVKYFKSIGNAIVWANSLLFLLAYYTVARTFKLNIIASIIVGVILFFNYQNIFSENLGTVLYFLLIYFIQKENKLFKTLCYLVLFSTLLLLTKNSYYFYLLPIPLVVSSIKEYPLQKKITFFILYIVALSGLFWGIKSLLNNTGSHSLREFSFLNWQNSIVELFTYLANPFDNLISAIIFPVLIILAFINAYQKKNWATFKYVFATFTILIITFSCVYIIDKLNYRFIYPLLILLIKDSLPPTKKYYFVGSLAFIALIYVLYTNTNYLLWKSNNPVLSPTTNTNRYTLKQNDVFIKRNQYISFGENEEVVVSETKNTVEISADKKTLYIPCWQ